MTDRCHTYQGVHIPGCWGCAIHGDWPHRMACTCPPKPAQEREDPLERRIARMERTLMELLDMVKGKPS